MKITRKQLRNLIREASLEESTTAVNSVASINAGDITSTIMDKDEKAKQLGKTITLLRDAIVELNTRLLALEQKK